MNCPREVEADESFLGDRLKGKRGKVFTTIIPDGPDLNSVADDLGEGPTGQDCLHGHL